MWESVGMVLFQMSPAPQSLRSLEIALSPLMCNVIWEKRMFDVKSVWNSAE